MLTSHRYVVVKLIKPQNKIPDMFQNMISRSNRDCVTNAKSVHSNNAGDYRSLVEGLENWKNGFHQLTFIQPGV